MNTVVPIVAILAILTCCGCKGDDPRNLVLHPAAGREISDIDLQQLATVVDMVFDHRRPSTIGKYHGVAVKSVDPCTSDLCGFAGSLEIVLDVAIAKCAAARGLVESRQYVGEGTLPAYEICVPAAYSAAHGKVDMSRWHEQQQRAPYARQ